MSITYQHIENAFQLMKALAILELTDRRHVAEKAVTRANAVAQEINADPKTTQKTHAVEILGFKIREALRATDPFDRSMGLYWMAALAIELGLEADETALAEARQDLAHRR